MARGIAPKRRNGIGMRGAALLIAALAGLALCLAGIRPLIEHYTGDRTARHRFKMFSVCSYRIGDSESRP